MCGIIGYIGDKKASELIYDGLKKIEYRGYDSAGMAIFDGEKINILKGEGKIKAIHDAKNFNSLEGNMGIGHTRWATHGPPCERNAHPHADAQNKVVVVHNGIIENFSELKDYVQNIGIKLKSDTDTEIIAHLISIESEKEPDTQKAIFNAINKLDGAYALAILIKGENKIFAARKNAPLVIGKGEGENFFASDIPALLDYTKDFILLDEGDFAQISKNEIKVFNSHLIEVRRKEIHVDWTSQMAQKNGHSHFMLKEILEQPQSIKTALSVDVKDTLELIKNSNNLAITACGTAYHAGLVLEYLLHKQGKNASTYIASEYTQWCTSKEDVLFAISQSGETADTLSAIRYAKKNGAKIIALTNVMGSSITREADVTLLMGAGPEIAVLATKTFTAQLAVIYKLAYSLVDNKEMLNKLDKIPEIIKLILKNTEPIKKLASDLGSTRDFFFLSRGLNYATALEGALKLKEVTYLHAEAYPAGELKHGPISLLESSVAVFAIAPSGLLSHKMSSNIKECQARDANVIVMSDDEKILKEGKLQLKMPRVESELVPLVYIVSLQLLSYYMALNLGKDPDQPRNLAKSVTVE